MYGKLAMTCFKYLVYLYGSEAITYLNALLSFKATEPACTMSHQTAPIRTTGSPPPNLYGSITFTHLEENSTKVKLPYLCKKKHWKNLYG
jgi:hypothetical protein